MSEPLADVIPIRPDDGDGVARVRKEGFQEGSELASSHEQSKRRRQEASEPRSRRSSAFDAIVAPLERAQDQRLYGAGLDACLAAFSEDPHGVEVVAAAVLSQWNGTGDIRKPLSVFCKRIEQGQHRRPAAGDDGSSTELSRAEAWVRKTGWQLEPEHALDTLRAYKLDDHDRETLAEVLDQLRAEHAHGERVTRELLDEAPRAS